MKKEEIFRYGIDKISLFNLKINTCKKWKIQRDENDYRITEKQIISEELFSIISSYSIINNDGVLEERNFNYLTFNPNVILEGNNIRNSTTEDLKIAIEKLKLILKSKGIDVELSEAKIMEIEFNINLPIDFNKNRDVFHLFINQFNDPKFIGRFIKSEKISDTRSDESYFTKLNKTSTFIIYSKDTEANYHEKVTRLEYRLGNDTYRYLANIHGYSNSLEDLLNNKIIPQDFFQYRAKSDFMRKVFSYLDGTLKPLLEREYLNFKEINAFARKHNKKENRDVYKHLTQFNIFDYSYLIELVEKHNVKNKSREIQRILRKYKAYDNLKKMEYIMNFILLTDIN